MEVGAGRWEVGSGALFGYTALEGHRIHVAVRVVLVGITEHSMVVLLILVERVQVV